MAQQIEKQIDQLQSQIEELKAKKEKEEREREILQRVYDNLKNELHGAEISLDSFFRFAYRDVKRVVARVEKEKAKDDATTGKDKPAAKKSTTKKKSTRKGRKKAKKQIKIPAGRYTNIPPETDKVYTVNEKGPRPKIVKGHAEAVGEERFMAECRIND